MTDTVSLQHCSTESSEYRTMFNPKHLFSPFVLDQSKIISEPWHPGSNGRMSIAGYLPKNILRLLLVASGAPPAPAVSTLFCAESSEYLPTGWSVKQHNSPFSCCYYIQTELNNWSSRDSDVHDHRLVFYLCVRPSSFSMDMKMNVTSAVNSHAPLGLEKRSLDL